MSRFGKALFGAALLGVALLLIRMRRRRSVRSSGVREGARRTVEVQVTRTAPGAQEDVFTLLSSPTEAPRWRDASVVRDLRAGPVEAGATWVEERQGRGGRVVQRRCHMNEWEPPSRCAWSSQSDRQTALWTLRCDNAGEGRTAVTLGLSFEMPAMPVALFGRGIRRGLEQRLTRHLERAAALRQPRSVS